jgi:hypothetical protein
VYAARDVTRALAIGTAVFLLALFEASPTASDSPTSWFLQVISAFDRATCCIATCSSGRRRSRYAPRQA